MTTYMDIVSKLKGGNTSPLLRHVHFTFLAVTDETLDVEELQLNVYSGEANGSKFISIVSGTLDEWQRAMINTCSPKSDTMNHAFMVECLHYFDKLGLGTLWSNFKRKSSPNGLILQ
jgi:hypothetical protein